MARAVSPGVHRRWDERLAAVQRLHGIHEGTRSRDSGSPDLCLTWPVRYGLRRAEGSSRHGRRLTPATAPQGGGASVGVSQLKRKENPCYSSDSGIRCRGEQSKRSANASSTTGKTWRSAATSTAVTSFGTLMTLQTLPTSSVPN